MNGRALLTAVVAIEFGCGHSESYPDRDFGAIGASEAVSLAEAFVRDNGYTDGPSLPAEKLAPESIEFSPHDEWASQRHNSLQSKAFGYRRGRRGNLRGW